MLHRAAERGMTERASKGALLFVSLFTRLPSLLRLVLGRLARAPDRHARQQLRQLRQQMLNI
jgi:hypothetical protein